MIPPCQNTDIMMSTSFGTLNNRSGTPKQSNLYLIGPQCSGKTTLLNALRAFYSDRDPASHGIEQPFFIEEVVRVIMHEKGFQARDLYDSVRGLQLQTHILLRQNQIEEQLKDRWFLADRSALDTLVYAKQYTGTDAFKALASTKEWENSRLRMQYATVIVCEAGNTEWLSADKVRLAYQDTAGWKALNESFFVMLREYGISYSVLPNAVKDLGERVALVSRLLNTDTSNACLEPVSF
ncbi:AAA domain-containing protein [Bipolaris maydis]|nr:AAA domain-containing protein [Bipolaris maydis]KAJ5052586.1 AAA domain-containing protein [Bipolaris maydis]KAJ6192259.1 AAA domain-containing protein [Bipolaris maydis]KAJ6267406.1 AAA domain-containing protein [Bipolaris maydis]KAJ6267642.1 AAA domain-containing protein [Bipolaris maydis]